MRVPTLEERHNLLAIVREITLRSHHPRGHRHWGAEWEEVTRLARARHDYPEDHTEEILEWLLARGDLFEPTLSIVRATREVGAA